MAIIQQKSILDWDEIEKSDELLKLELVLKFMPDEKIIDFLKSKRGHGRNKYPIRFMWNAMIAGIILGHETIESLLRELRRNPIVSRICGFIWYRSKDIIPTSSAFSRFMKTLIKYQFEVQSLFEDIINQLYELLPDFGKNLALDGKAINSFGNRNNEDNTDQRAEHDADWGVHKYTGIGKDGRVWENVKKWFGFKLHLIVDSKYELPISFTVTKASSNEIPIGRTLVENLSEKKKERAEYFTADRGLDDTKLINMLEDNDIHAVIDIRNQWKDPDKTKLVPGTTNIVYNYRGTVSCICPVKNKAYEMAYAGFEKKRNTQKFRCPAKHYGWKCKGQDQCPIKSSIRIPRKTDERIFTSVARHSYKWDRKYKDRTAVERVNSRIDNLYGFEKHTLRGKRKTTVRMALAFIVMTSLALAWIKEGKQENIRKLRTG